MPLEFSATILDLDDKPYDDTIAMQSNGQIKKQLTLAGVCCHALSMNFPDENIAADKKFERGMLAYRIAKGELAELSTAEIEMVKPLIGKLYGPIVVMRVFQMLDPVGAAKT